MCDRATTAPLSPSVDPAPPYSWLCHEATTFAPYFAETLDMPPVLMGEAGQGWGRAVQGPQMSRRGKGRKEAQCGQTGRDLPLGGRDISPTGRPRTILCCCGAGISAIAAMQNLHFVTRRGQ